MMMANYWHCGAACVSATSRGLARRRRRDQLERAVHHAGVMLRCRHKWLVVAVLSHASRRFAAPMILRMPLRSVAVVIAGRAPINITKCSIAVTLLVIATMAIMPRPPALISVWQHYASPASYLSSRSMKGKRRVLVGMMSLFFAMVKHRADNGASRLLADFSACQ